MACYDTIHLEKGMYAMPGKSFTQVLEELDDSSQYIGTPLEGLDAYQRQLKRFDIHVGGPDSDRLEKFFRSTASAALFPEYVARAVRQGMESNGNLSDIVATVTNIEAQDYRAIVAEPEDGNYHMKSVDENGQLPTTYIRTQGGLVELKKRGRMLAATYEAVRFHKLDVFTVLLRQMGAFIAEGMMNDAVTTLVNGDGWNDGAASTTLTAAITYADLTNLWCNMAPYHMTTLLGGTSAIRQIFNLTEMKDSAAGNDFHGTGRLGTPLGAQLIHLPGMTTTQLVAVDKNCALEMVQAGGILMDHDRLIDHQFERAAISTVTGFAMLFPDAAYVLNGK